MIKESNFTKIIHKVRLCVEEKPWPTNLHGNGSKSLIEKNLTNPRKSHQEVHSTDGIYQYTKKKTWLTL